LKKRMGDAIRRLYKAEEKLAAKDENGVIRLSEDSYKLLENVNSHPFNGIAGRQKELGISAARLEKAKEELISKGLVEQVNISLSGGRPASFLVLTERALRLLESKGLATSLWRHVGNIGFEHMLYQALIRWEFLKLGYNAHIEASLNGRRIDVLVVKDGRKIGIEVELSANVDLKQKLNGIDSLDELYIITRNDLFGQIKDRLGPLPNKVKVYSIDVFLKSLRNLSIEKVGMSSFKQNKAESNSFWRNNSVTSFSSKKEFGGKKNWERTRMRS
ncbi:MAG: hypothetical protein ACUVTD_06530, partial [Nitrososphaerales archaeon]